MKKILYIPINDCMRDSAFELPIDKDTLRVAFNKKAQVDLNVDLNKELYQDAAINFILEFCLIVSLAEAYNVSDLYIPIKKESLNKLAINIDVFLNSLRLLAKETTPKKVYVHFPFSIDTINSITTEYNIDEVDLNNIEKVTNVYSSGLDCTVASYYLNRMNISQDYLFFNYGQNNINEELLCMHKQCRSRNIEKNRVQINEHLKIFFSNIKFSTGLLNRTKITTHNKKAEYVPFRNSIFISYALNQASSSNSNCIVTGSHLDDVNSPDNSPKFYRLWNDVLKNSKQFNNLFILPILFKFGGKKEVVRLGNDMGVDYSQTWTCHNTSSSEEVLIQCGICNDCLTRKAAFEKNGISDPILYNYSAEG